MRFQGSALGALFLGLATLAPAAQAVTLDPETLSGLVLSLGQAHSRNDQYGMGNVLFADANYSRVFLNGGVSYKDFADKVVNAYVGIGITGLIQLQIGMGTEGVVQRIRSDLNPTKFIDVLSGTKSSRYNQSFGTRLTFTFALEDYKDDDRFDNIHTGIGLLY